jgi:hypothetical protein
MPRRSIMLRRNSTRLRSITPRLSRMHNRNIMQHRNSMRLRSIMQLRRNTQLRNITQRQNMAARRRSTLRRIPRDMAAAVDTTTTGMDGKLVH